MMTPRLEFARHPLFDRNGPNTMPPSESGATQALAKKKLIPTAMMMIGTIIGEIRMAVISRRYGISGRDSPRAASVPRNVARTVAQSPTHSELRAALSQVAESQAVLHQVLSRGPSGAGWPSVRMVSYQRRE